MQLEILVVGLVVAGRINVGDRPRTADLLGQLDLGAELFELSIEGRRVAIPVEETRMLPF